jgi:hypothetical protein
MHMLVSAPSQLAPAKPGAVYEGTIESVAAGRISAVEEALLGATSLGSGLFLC